MHSIIQVMSLSLILIDFLHYLQWHDMTWKFMTSLPHRLLLVHLLLNVSKLSRNSPLTMKALLLLHYNLFGLHHFNCLCLPFNHFQFNSHQEIWHDSDYLSFITSYHPSTLSTRGLQPSFNTTLLRISIIYSTLPPHNRRNGIRSKWTAPNHSANQLHFCNFPVSCSSSPKPSLTLNLTKAD